MKSELKERVLLLRREGKTYGEIQTLLGKKIPKSTLSNWCKSIHFSSGQLNRMERRIRRGGEIGRATALATKRAKRESYMNALFERNVPLRAVVFSNKDVAKVALAILYLAEGGKRQKGSLMFGNSDPHIVGLFLELLRFVYEVDIRKFRCTVQCRADQDTKMLNRFWSKLTGIPLLQFYKPRIDVRTIGMKSRKPHYKGVCRIDYFSANIYNDLLVAGRIVSGNGSKQ